MFRPAGQRRFVLSSFASGARRFRRCFANMICRGDLATDGVADRLVRWFFGTTAGSGRGNASLIGQRRSRLEGLEPRVVLNADFTVAGGLLTLDNFAGTDLSIDDGVVVVNTNEFTLTSGVWSGADIPGEVVGAGTATLSVNRLAPPLINEIITDVSAAASNVSFSTPTEFSIQDGGLFISGASVVDILDDVVVDTLSIDADEISISVAGDIDAIDGPGSFISLTAQDKILLDGTAGNGGRIFTNNTDVTLSANQDLNTLGDFAGVLLTDGALIQSTGLGNILLSGRGGDDAGTSEHRGVSITNNSTVESLAASDGGTITLTGIGGVGINENQGIDISNTSRLSSASGNITITGSSNGTGENNEGVTIRNTTTVESTGNLKANAATIHIQGTGGNSSAAGSDVNTDGVTVKNTSVLHTIAGDIEIHGTGGNTPAGEHSNGVNIRNTATVASLGTTTVNAGEILIHGIGGAAHEISDGVNIRNTATLQSVAGNIQITGIGGTSNSVDSRGVSIYNGATIRSDGPNKTDAALITIDGTGGNAPDGVEGVLIEAGGEVRSLAGDVDITGIGGSGLAPYDEGVAVTTGGLVQSRGVTASEAALIRVHGTTGPGGGNLGVLQDAGGGIASIRGAIEVLSPNDIHIKNNSLIGIAPPPVGAQPDFTVFIGTDGSLQVDGTSTLVAPGGLTVNNDGGSFIDAVIDDDIPSGGLSKDGAGTLDLNAANTYTGDTTIVDGVLEVNGSITSNVMVDPPGTLGGDGDVNGTVTVNSGASVGPGGSTGILNTGSVAFTASANFEVELQEQGGLASGTPVAGDDFDQLNVTGTVALNNATLDISGIGAIPAIPLGTAFEIISNDGVDPVVGTFNGLPNGAVFTAVGQNFQVFYDRNAGQVLDNDVTLLRADIPNLLNVAFGGNNMVMIDENGSVALNVDFANANENHTVSINWGDNTTSVFNNVVPGSYVFNHTYLDDNPSVTPMDTYNVVVEITDATGHSAIDNSNTVKVRNLAPVFDGTPTVTPNVAPSGTNILLEGQFDDVGTLDDHGIDIDINGDGTYDISILNVNAGEFAFNVPVNLPPGQYDMIVKINDDDGGSTISSSIPFFVVNAVVNVSTFYNNSAFDGNGAVVTAADFNAIATDKAALGIGELATIANVSAYNKGLNGFFIDVESLPNNGADIDSGDFMFMVGNDNFPDTWPNAPAPTNVGVLANAGVGGADRIFVTFADGAIVNTWLRLVVKGNADTGLLADQSFFFGSLSGDTGAGNGITEASVTADDFLNVAVNITPLGLEGTEPIVNVADTTKDATVDAFDFLAAAVNLTSSLNFILPVLGAPAIAGSNVAVAGSTVGSFALPGDRLTSPAVTVDVLFGQPADQRVDAKPKDGDAFAVEWLVSSKSTTSDFASIKDDIFADLGRGLRT